MTLTEFLLARIADDGRAAQLSTEPFMWGDRTGLDQLHPMLVAHVRNWTPHRVMAECEAKRRIIGLRPLEVLSVNPQAWRLKNLTLRMLSLSYADHPDYRQEWRP